mmetsp:Transcript_88900/g.251495  ORF Transcript_88900/g.251495 Transcript_88900/m.251495 type:complete len:205 (-) Transcript_88900:118-732(-)
MLAVGRRQVQQVGAVLRKEAAPREVGTEAARAQDHRAVLAEGLAALRVQGADAAAVPVSEQLLHVRLGDDARQVRALAELLEHLDQGVGDGHPGEPLGPTVRPWCRVAAEPRQQRQVQIERVHQPLHVRAAVAAEHLDQLGLLGPALQRVRGEKLLAVLDALRPLRLRVGTVDPAGRLRRIASAEGRLVKQHYASAALDNGVGS